MKLFFAIPYFNNAIFLRETLQSLVSQSYTLWQAVVFDDSIDLNESTAAMTTVKELNDTRISFVKNEKNLGMAKNWNQGLDYAMNSVENFSGVTLLHGDDKLAPDYALSMTKAIIEHPQATAFFCKTSIIDENGKDSFSFVDWYKTTLIPRESKIILDGIDGIKTIIPGNFVFCPTLCFVPKILGSRRFRTDLKMVLDFDITVKILLEGGQLVGLYEKPLYRYRRHSNNATNAHNRSLVRFHEESNLYLDLAKLLEEKNFPTLAQEARKLKIIKLNLLFNFAKSLLSGRPREAILFLKFFFQKLT